MRGGREALIEWIVKAVGGLIGTESKGWFIFTCAIAAFLLAGFTAFLATKEADRERRSRGPKLSLEFDNGVRSTSGNLQSGISIINSGGPAHRVEVIPDRRVGLPTLEFDTGTQIIPVIRDKYPLPTMRGMWTNQGLDSKGGLVPTRMDLVLSEWKTTYKQDPRMTVVLKYEDEEGKDKYERRCSFFFDDYGGIQCECR